MTQHRRVQFVVKVSKHCNLRCRYCYEYAELGNKQRMTPEQLETLFAHVASWHAKLTEPTQVEFVWHGGEPLLLPPEYYYQAFEAQKRIFGERAFVLRNVVQTNLTVLDDARIELLRKFDGVGVSIDLYGALRVNAGNEDSVKKALANMDRLRAAKVDFGCITVLTSANLPHLKKIIRFYDQLKVSSVRILPLFDGAAEGQHKGYEITAAQVLEGFQSVFEELLALDSSLRVEPLHRFLNQVVHHHTPDAAPVIYDKRSWEPVYVVNLDGDLYSYAETYEKAFCHGNLFEQPLEALVHSPGHLNAIEAAEARMAPLCRTCRFFGSCDGYPVAEDAGRYRMTREAPECSVERPMLEYLERRLTELGAIHPVTSQIRLTKPRASFQNIESLPLEADVRIRVLGDPTQIIDRISINTGTMLAVEPPGDGLQYLKAAIVPKETWRPLTPREASMLVAPAGTKGWNVGADVGIVRIPDEVIAPLEQIFEDHGTRERLDPEGYQPHTQHPNWDSAYGLFIDHVKERYALRDQVIPQVVRLATAPPGMRTVTKDTVKDRNEHYYVGMHLDTWENIALSDRHTARNRVCINLGREDRYFLFFNLSLMRMFRALGGEDPNKADDFYGTDLGHAFMRAFPGYPMLRLRLKPREAYIAPTDNLIHDGSSLDKRYPDIALHVLGYFGFPPEHAAVAVEERASQSVSV